MSPHGRTVLRDLGVVLHVPGLMAVPFLAMARAADAFATTESA